MSKREILGTMDCPECGMSGAEIKAQKTGLLYRWCPECNAQYFPRTAEASERLEARAGIGKASESPVTGTKQKAAIEPKVSTPARAGFNLGL